MRLSYNYIKQLICSAPSLWILISLFMVFPIYTTLAGLPFWNDLAMRIMLLGIAAMGLNLILGYGGMISFGHAAFIGIGAYCVGISNFYGLDNGWVQLALTLGLCGLFGFIIGYLSLRTSGIYFIMITLAFAQMSYFLFISLEMFGGDDGMITDRSDFGLFDIYAPLRLYYLIFCALVLTALILSILITSRFGVILRAIRSNPTRVRAMGIPILRFKIVAYVISAMICGGAGMLFASWQEYVSPDILHWTRSGELMIIIVLGGIATPAGPLLGAICFLLLEEFLPLWLGLLAPDYVDHWMIILGPILIAVVLFAKGGVLGGISQLSHIFGKLRGHHARDK